MTRYSYGLLLVIFSLCLLAPNPAVSGEEKWAFLWAEPARNDYEVWQGSAAVTLKDGLLSAKMRSEKGVELLLTGRVSKGKVTARLTILGSEFGDVPFSGTYVARRWPDARVLIDAPIGTDSIVLTDGLNVLALKREKFRPAGEIPPTRDQ